MAICRACSKLSMAGGFTRRHVGWARAVLRGAGLGGGVGYGVDADVGVGGAAAAQSSTGVVWPTQPSRRSSQSWNHTGMVALDEENG